MILNLCLYLILKWILKCGRTVFFPYICSVVTATESNLHCMKSITLRYIVALFVLLVSYAPYAQTSIFRGLSVTEGPSDLVVNALYKDSIGYVWIGT